ncbi:MAG TPA: YhjD/YihY/BrkB family envelope integrity protein, partial [Balneolaceae bacterium]|nr:YhjD/YihY/BrkB family envelope integrity protein [Balneolaceae bacterium]
AVLLWLAVAIGFTIYINNFGNYSATYGSLAAIIILMMWFFITAFIILLGAEINYTIEKRASDRQT